MNFLLNYIPDIVVILLVIGLLYLCGKSVFSKKSSCAGCGCGKSCAGCTMACANNLKNIKIKGS